MNISLISLLGLFCYLISFILWMLIISRSDVSYIVPLGVACTNIAILIASNLILKRQSQRMPLLVLWLLLSAL